MPRVSSRSVGRNRKGDGLMAEGSPAEVAVELYNRLVYLPPSDVVTIGRIEWRLRTLRNRRSGDGSIGVALLQALLLLGKAAEAVELADQLWPARFTYDPQVLRTFASLLAEMGQYERALAIALPNGLVDRPLDRESELFTVLVSAWALGDLPLTRSVMNADEDEQRRVVWNAVLDRFEECGIAALFSGHQRIVRDALAGRQCLIEVMPQRDEEGQLELVQYSYVSGDREERAELEEQIQVKLDQYYRAHDRDGAAAFGLLHVVVSDVTAGPRQRDHDYARDAA